eukprot:1187165-Prorocentrum_minimum.AAC.5
MGEVSSPEIPDGVHPRSAPGGIPMMRDLESLTPKELKNVRGKVIKTLAKLNEHRAQRRSLMEEVSPVVEQLRYLINSSLLLTAASNPPSQMCNIPNPTHLPEPRYSCPDPQSKQDAHQQHTPTSVDSSANHFHAITPTKTRAAHEDRYSQETLASPTGSQVFHIYDSQVNSALRLKTLPRTTSSKTRVLALSTSIPLPSHRPPAGSRPSARNLGGTSPPTPPRPLPPTSPSGHLQVRPRPRPPHPPDLPGRKRGHTFGHTPPPLGRTFSHAPPPLGRTFSHAPPHLRSRAAAMSGSAATEPMPRTHADTLAPT